MLPEIDLDADPTLYDIDGARLIALVRKLDEELRLLTVRIEEVEKKLKIIEARKSHLDKISGT